MTEYNSKIYQVDKFLADENPTKTFKFKGQDISIMQYFKEKHKTELDP